MIESEDEAAPRTDFALERIPVGYLWLLALGGSLLVWSLIVAAIVAF